MSTFFSTNLVTLVTGIGNVQAFSGLNYIWDVTINVYKCPNATCTTCLTYNSVALRGICTACSAGYEVYNELCWLKCGNTVYDSPEECDDGNINPGDGCSATCTVEPGYTCIGFPSTCSSVQVCPNGVVESGEACDDNNGVDDDGCTSC